MDLRERILADDLELIIEQLNAFADYDFAQDIKTRMHVLGINTSALAERALVSPQMVGR